MQLSVALDSRIAIYKPTPSESSSEKVYFHHDLARDLLIGPELRVDQGGDPHLRRPRAVPLMELRWLAPAERWRQQHCIVVQQGSAGGPHGTQHTQAFADEPIFEDAEASERGLYLPVWRVTVAVPVCYLKFSPGSPTTRLARR